MPRYQVEGMITVGVSYLVDADDEDAAMDTDVRPRVVVLDHTGRGLGMVGAVGGSVQFYIDGCFPEPNTANLEGGS